MSKKCCGLSESVPVVVTNIEESRSRRSKPMLSLLVPIPMYKNVFIFVYIFISVNHDLSGLCVRTLIPYTLKNTHYYLYILGFPGTITVAQHIDESMYQL